MGKQMLKKNIIGFIVILLIVSSINLNYISAIINNEVQWETSSETITDFNDFVKVGDSALISSSKSSTEIQMSAVYNSNPLSEWEYYDLIFDTGWTVNNFDLQMNLDYYYSGGMITAIYVIAGSLHNEAGETVPANNICIAGVWDPWSGSSGQYIMTVYPSSSDQKTNSGISRDEIITIHMWRTSSQFSCTIIKDGITKLSGIWSLSGLTRDLDYIRVLLNVNTNYIQNTFATFNSINLLLNGNFPPNTNTGTSNPINSNIIIGISVGSTILLIGLVGGIIFLSKRRKKTGGALNQTIPQQSKQLSFLTQKNNQSITKEELSDIKSDSAVYSWQIEDNEQ